MAYCLRNLPETLSSKLVSGPDACCVAGVPCELSDLWGVLRPIGPIKLKHRFSLGSPKVSLESPGVPWGALVFPGVPWCPLVSLVFLVSLLPGPWPVVLGSWSLVPGHWPLVPGHWSLVLGPLYYGRGTMVPWYHGTMLPRYHGAMVQGSVGPMIPRYHCTMVAWCRGTMLTWYHGAMLPWFHGAMPSR